MSIIAKFRLDHITSSLQTKLIDKTKPWQADNIEKVEMRTLEFNPVFSNGDPNHENSKFWEATPSGKITLGTINPAAWQAFDLGEEVYVTFSRTKPE